MTGTAAKNAEESGKMPRKLKRPEVNIVTSGVCRIEQLHLGLPRENSAAVRTETPDHAVQCLPFIFPGVLIDFRHDKRHSEPFDKTE